MTQDSNLKFSDTICRRLKFTIIVLLAIAGFGICYHIVTYLILRYTTEHHSVLAVATTRATSGPSEENIILPGSIRAWHETTIYARTNGYVVNWLVDIGSHVKEGDLLAEITAPEIVAQLHQTEADLVTAEANYDLAKTTATRWKFLLKTESVSKQETDEKVSDEAAKAAIVSATRANRDRLRDLVNFQRIIAPFDGVIMSRTTDIGRLINAGSGTVPLFRLVQTNRLRVYVRVPEYYAPEIMPNLTAELYFTEHPGKVYTAKLLDTAQAIDNTTHTLLIQLALDNPNDEILAGSYTQVHLSLPVSKNIVHLPVNTLIFRAEGLQVATIDGDHKTLLKHIVLGREFDDYVEVLSGIKPGESVILNPSDSLISGQEVKIVSSDGPSKDNSA